MNNHPPAALRSTATRPAAITSNRPQGGQASSQARTAGISPAVARSTTQARPGSLRNTLPGLTAAFCLTLTALLHHTSRAAAINPDPGSGQVSAISITRGVPAGDSYDPLVALPGGEVYEIPPDRTGRISLTLGITHDFQGTVTTSIRDSDGARIAAATGDQPTLTFDPLKFRYPFILTVESPTAAPSRTILIAPRNIGNAIGPGFTGSLSSHDPNLEDDDEYRIDQGNDSGSYDIEGKDISSGACGACRSSSCDLSHANETANADATGPHGRFLAGFSAGISMQGDSFTGVDVEINPAAGVSRASFKSHGTGDATIARVDDLDDGNLRAITTGSAHTTFADIANGVRISIAKDSDPATTAFRTITFVNTATNQVTRTSTYGGESIQTIWSYDDTGHPTWTVITGNGARKSKLILEVDTATLRIQRRELYERAHGTSGIAAVLVSEVLETYQKTILGWRKTKSEIIGDSGPSPTTTWEYFGPADGLTKAGLPASITRPDGATETHNYYISRSTYHTISRPFPDGTNPLIETRAKTTTGSWSYTDLKVGANFLSQGYNSWSGTTMTRFHHDGTAYRSTTHTVNAFGTDFGGIPTSVAMPDGTRVTQAHDRTGGTRNLTVDAGVPDGAEIGEGTTTLTTRDHNGILRTKFVAAIGTGAGDGTVLNDFRVIGAGDALGRPTTFHYFPDAQDIPAYAITRDYACCGLLSETDKHGLTTTYEYDDLGRRTHVNRQSVTRATVYDGLTVSTHRYPENPAVDPSGTPPLSRTTRNLAGTVVTSESPDPSALDGQGDGIPGALTTTTTTVSYSSAGTTTETAISGSGAQTTHTHPGGRTWKTTGNLSPRRIHAYAVNPTGLVTASAYLISDGATPTIAEPTATQFDRAGRIVATGILPDLAPATLLAANDNSGATLSHATRFFYNGLGQLAKTTDADNVTTLHAYNDLGERTTTAIKLDNESTITYGTDRVTRTTTFPHAGNIRTTTEVWQDGATATQSTLVSQTDRTPDGLQSLSWQIGRGATPNDPTATFTHTQTDLQGNGAWTTTTTHPDGTKTKEIHTGGRLTRVESLSADDPALVIAYTEYGYEDATNGIPGRLRTTTDSRTGPTTTAYISTTCDAVKSVTDPGDRTTSFTYDPRGNRTEVDAEDTPNPAGGEHDNITITAYDSYGRVETVTGATYPVSYTYDYAGRMKTMTTNGAAGAAITAWNYSPSTGLLDSKRYDSNPAGTAGAGPSYTYTAAGRLETSTNARNITATQYYTKGGQLRAIDYSGPTPDILYDTDCLGRILHEYQGTLTVSNGIPSMPAPARGDSYTYDPAHLALQTETHALGAETRTLVRTYDTYGRTQQVAAGINTDATPTTLETTEHFTGYRFGTDGRLLGIDAQNIPRFTDKDYGRAAAPRRTW